MSNKFHLFNPENDLALALGCRNYTPPPHAAALHRAGALFPAWWSEDGDGILASENYQDDAEKLRSQFGIDIKVGHIPDSPIFSPWGWSLDAMRQFNNELKSKGIVDNIHLPTDEAIQQMRQLSHRRSSIHILSQLDMGIELPIETSDPEEVLRQERLHPGCFIKSPWSSSGRGVFNAYSLDKTSLRQRVEGIIRRQGSVMVERGLNKTMDFAALFHAADGIVKFRGLSIFQAESRGMYAGNIVASQPHLESMLHNHVDINKLHIIIAKLENILTTLLSGKYYGWLGIDMMSHVENGEEKIMPCVELNLRMTMGVAAMKINERLNLATPRLLNWEHHIQLRPGDIQLLPPREEFSLRLKKKN